MGDANAGSEILLTERERLRKIGAEQRDFLPRSQFRNHRKHRRKTNDVMPPESSANLREVSLIEISAVTRRLQIDSANLQIKTIFLRSHHKIRAIAAQLTVNL